MSWEKKQWNLTEGMYAVKKICATGLYYTKAIKRIKVRFDQNNKGRNGKNIDKL